MQFIFRKFGGRIASIRDAVRKRAITYVTGGSEAVSRAENEGLLTTLKQSHQNIYEAIQ